MKRIEMKRMKKRSAFALTDIIQAGRRVDHHFPWTRAIVAQKGWNLAAEQLAGGRWSLLGLWGEPGAVHMALLDEDARDIGVVSLKCPDGRYPSVGLLHPPALRLERAAADLFGLVPEGLPDTRQWLDHNQWGIGHPLGAAVPVPTSAPPYSFLPAEGESLHQIPVGPVHAGIIEPGHFRFSASGETIVRLEERLGYVHKGIEGLMAGSTTDRAAKLAAERPATALWRIRLRLPARSKRRWASRHRGVRSGCERSWPSWSVWPTIWAISAPSATTPPSR